MPSPSRSDFGVSLAPEHPSTEPRRHAPRWLKLAAGAGALAIALVAALTIVDLLRIRGDLAAGQDRLTGLTITDVGSAEKLDAATSDAQRLLHRAEHRAATSPWLKLAAVVPVARTQVHAVRDLAGAAGQIADLAHRAATDLAPAIERAGDEPAARVDLLDAALDELDVVADGLAAIEPGAGGMLLPPLSGARRTLVERLDKAATDLADGRRSVAALRRFLAGPGNHLILAANQAEMTAGSGMPLSAGVARVSDGDIEVGDFVPTSDLYLGANGVDAPGDLRRLYAPMGMGRDFRGTTASPNFPVTAPLLRQMAAKTAIGPVDSVFVVDAVVLRKIVELTGPVTVDGVRYSAENLEAEVLNGNYLRFDSLDDRDQRTELQSRIARAVFDALQSREVDLGALAAGIRDAALGRHFLAWSADPDLQEVWDRAGATGALPRDGLMVSTENYDGNKLDYYLQPTVDLEVDAAADGARRVRLSVHIPNMPRDPTSPTIEGPDPSNHWVFLDVHLPADAYAIGIEAEGTRSIDQGRDGPAPVVTMIYPVALGTTKTVAVEFALPSSVDEITLLPSARRNPLVVDAPGGVVNDAVETTITLPGPTWRDQLGGVIAASFTALAALGFALSSFRSDRLRFDRAAALVLLATAITLAAVFADSLLP